MARTTHDIYNIFGKDLIGWKLNPVPPISDNDKTKIGLGSNSPEFNILISPEGEEIVLSIVKTSITGTDRPKPQIRIFTNSIFAAYKYSKLKHLRFFAFVLCTSDKTLLKFPSSFNPDDYLLAIETNFDNATEVRADIRSIYEYLLTIGSKNFIRLTSFNHNCTMIDQASFIRVFKDDSSFDYSTLEKYLTYFDNRPYMTSIQEGSRIVYQPSALFEKCKTTDIKYPWNLLVFGAPGTGKSFLLQKFIEEYQKDFGSEYIVSERVTFFEDYTYNQFVGSYMPIPKSDMQETINIMEGSRSFEGSIIGEHITYKFVPGPFASILAKALISKLKGEQTKYILIIEELNRANAASVFGDIFQLLDREMGVSNYDISLPDGFVNYLYQTISEVAGQNALDETFKISHETFCKIKLPDNLHIWATMNSADQGVFPLDSAFKRRWTFLYKDIDDINPSNANRISICLPTFDDSLNVEAKDFDWNTFRKAINNVIIDAGFDEDRCIGYWFFSSEEIEKIKEYTQCSVKAYNGDAKAEKELQAMSTPLVDKLFSYLRQDVFRNYPTKFFSTDFKTLSSIRRGMKFFEKDEKKPVGLKDITFLKDDAFVLYDPVDSKTI